MFCFELLYADGTDLTRLLGRMGHALAGGLALVGPEASRHPTRIPGLTPVSAGCPSPDGLGLHTQEIVTQSDHCPQCDPLTFCLRGH